MGHTWKNGVSRGKKGQALKKGHTCKNGSHL